MDNLTTIISFFKEIIMQYGFLETILGIGFLIAIWRLPNILSVIKDWHKK